MNGAQSRAPFSAAARNALTVFFLCGMLMSFPGAILPAWGYHLKDEFNIVGFYFLALAAGLLVSVKVGPRLRAWKDTKTVLTYAAALASFSLLWLAMASPPAAWGWRVAGIVLMGLAAGLLNSFAFQSISTFYEENPAATVNMAGAMFGLGCVASSLMIGMTFYIYTVSSMLILMAALPGFAAGLYHKQRFEVPVAHTQQSWREVWADVRSPGVVLFSLLLFFQFGNEWTVAGWLPIFLVHRVGLSPNAALAMLSAFWLALLLGRVAAQALLVRMSHGRLLGASALSAFFGSLILIATNNHFGAWTGVLLLGGGFAMIYPLVVEKIGHRFPNYHPGFFNGLFSVGITGGLFAPWTIGFLADSYGVWIVMALPLAGTVMVFLLIVAVWFEAMLTSAKPATRAS